MFTPRYDLKTWTGRACVLLVAACFIAFGIVADRLSAELVDPGVIGAMLINTGSLKALFTGFKANFNNGFAGVAPAWNRIATEVPSSTSEEEYGWLGQFPGFREWIGDRQVKSLSVSSYAIKNKPWEQTVGVDRDRIEDDRFGIFAPMMTEMGRSAAAHPDRLVFQLLAAGFSTTCYDGQYFFDTDHPVGTGVVSNSGGGSGAGWYLLDASRALKPLIYQVRKPYNFVSLTNEEDEAVFTRKEFRYGVDSRSNVGYGFWQMAYGSKQTLDLAAYTAARTAMMKFTNDAGDPLGIMPNLLVVGPSNERVALELVRAERGANGADNVMRGTAEVLVSPWLA